MIDLCPAPEASAPAPKSTATWHQGISGTLGVLCGLGAIWLPKFSKEFVASAALFGGYCGGNMKGNSQREK
jgi:hypothetical protein